MEIVFDKEGVSESGMNGFLFRVEEEGDTLSAVIEPLGTDPNSFVGGVIGSQGIIYLGNKQTRLDGKRGAIIFNDGTEDVVTLGRLSDGTYGIDVADGKISGSWIVARSITADQIEVGTITASEIAAGSITSNELAANSVIAGKIAAGAINATNIIVDGTITAAKMNVTTLSAITANLGTITAGAISGTSITLPYEDLGDAGNLRWVNDNNKIWTDSSQFMGFKSAGGRFYFYDGSALPFLIDNDSGSINSNIKFIVGALAGTTANTEPLQVGSGSIEEHITLYGYLTFGIDGSSVNNSLYKFGNTLRYRDGSGTVYSVDMTAV